MQNQFKKKRPCKHGENCPNGDKCPYSHKRRYAAATSPNYTVAIGTYDQEDIRVLESVAGQIGEHGRDGMDLSKLKAAQFAANHVHRKWGTWALFFRAFPEVYTTFLKQRSKFGNVVHVRFFGTNDSGREGRLALSLLSKDGIKILKSVKQSYKPLLALAESNKADGMVFLSVTVDFSPPSDPSQTSAPPTTKRPTTEMSTPEPGSALAAATTTNPPARKVAWKNNDPLLEYPEAMLFKTLVQIMLPFKDAPIPLTKLESVWNANDMVVLLKLCGRRQYTDLKSYLRANARLFRMDDLSNPQAVALVADMAFVLISIFKIVSSLKTNPQHQDNLASFDTSARTKAAEIFGSDTATVLPFLVAKEVLPKSAVRVIRGTHRQTFAKFARDLPQFFSTQTAEKNGAFLLNRRPQKT